MALTIFASLQAAEKKKVVEVKIRPIDLKEAAKVSFTRDIKPILVNTCVECHSPEDRKSNFEVTSVETLKQKGKKAGPGVIPGKPDESSIVQYIRGVADGPQMPKGEPRLSEDELHLIRMWIAAGAKDDSAEIASQKSGNGSLTGLNPDAQKLLNRLLYENLSANERFVLTRQFRATFLPASPKIPQTENRKSDIVNPIDAFIFAKWNEAKLPEAKQFPSTCDDSTFLRRVYLDLTGLIPSVEAAQKFIANKNFDKRTKLVDELLARSGDYATHWTPFWEEALGSSTQDINGGIGSRGNNRQWIFDSFKANKPYDLFVAELIDPTLPGYRAPKAYEPNGHHVISGYIKSETHEETLQTAANVSQVFLGTGMKCASCHSHFLNKEWPQARFLSFGGMFAKNDLELIRCEKKSGQIIPAKFPFELPNAPDEVPKDETNRLHRVAQLLVDPTNPRFAKTIVNRLWKRYVGLGIFEPVDDFRLDQSPSHPELLEWLADDFMRSGFDLKHTIRLILTSRTYQLRYNPELEGHFDVAKPTEPRYFRSPQLRRLTAEQLIDSIHFAADKNLALTNRVYLDKNSTALTRALGRPASRGEISTGRSGEVAVVQTLELLNGAELYKFVYEGKLLAELAPEKNPEKIVEELYWTALSRAPKNEELNLSVKYLQTAAVEDNRPTKEGRGESKDVGHLSSSGIPKEAFGDVLWALFVSPEFQYIH
ncbi:MAG: PSD1 and planctomycete cytochrome C domain-containing protein [Verrucomicrobiota bacterium]|nr:PSD1 and planctomycete cytochrome C domain-containing protein [Verrucomicrobiota bacterium]